MNSSAGDRATRLQLSFFKKPFKFPIFLLIHILFVSTCARHAAVAGSARFDPDRFWRSSDLEQGLKGYGITVFRGVELERFEVEILGVIRNEWSETDLILARCSGGPLEKTGVIAGMSGSPIFIDDKMIGALAYAWGFSKEPIAGITPIEDMLPVLDYPSSEREPDSDNDLRVAGVREEVVASPFLWANQPLSWEDWKDRFLAWKRKDHSRVLDSPDVGSRARDFSGANPIPVDRGPQTMAPLGGSMMGFEAPDFQGWIPLATPISISGLSGATFDQLKNILSPMGLSPVLGGMPSAYRDVQVELEPGSAVGVAMVQGDLEMAGIGTVTYRDGDRILGFGHPMFEDGPTDLPMTSAFINTVLPSLALSTKMGGMIDVVGALEQDRMTAIGGTLGAESRTLPFDVHIAHKSGGFDRNFHYDVTYHRFYTGRFALFCAFDAVSVSARAFRDSTSDFELRVNLKDHDPVVVRDKVSSSMGTAFSIAMMVGSALDLLLKNPYERLDIQSLELEIAIEDRLRTGTIEWIQVENTSINPGDELTLRIGVQPWLGEPEALRHQLTLPENISPGSVLLTVADAQQHFSQMLARNPDNFRVRDAESLLELMNQNYRNDEIFVSVAALSLGISEHGHEMPDLPSSVLRVMAQSSERGTGSFVPTKMLLQEAIRVDRPLSGNQKIVIDVQPSTENRLY